MREPAAYFITFRTYGSWLHGIEGSVDRDHNAYGTPFLAACAERERSAAARRKGAEIVLSAAQRASVRRTIEAVSRYRGWELRAVNVRSTHVHVVLSAAEAIEQVMNTLKAYATRRLREEGLFNPEGQVWSRHGSTQYVWNPRDLEPVVDYVANQQDGERFAE
jgi:REP element-mobilizing transposase RayT